MHAIKRFDEAIEAYRRAIAIQPGFADAWSNLGTSLHHAGHYEEGMAALRRGAGARPRQRAFRPRHPPLDAWRFRRRLSSLLIDQKQVEEAAAAAERALALAPDNHDAVNLMSRIAFERGSLEDSLAFYRRALALKPDLADAHNNMGNVLKELGHLDDARAAYLKALELDPKSTGVYVNLADAMRFSPGDPHLAAMQALAAEPEDLTAAHRLELDFALAKAYADLKDHDDRSFGHLLRANAGKCAAIRYDEAAIMALFNRSEAAFSAELFAAHAGQGESTAAPIFVLGMPRSSTALIEQILASHPQVHGAGELGALNEMANQLRGPDGNIVPYPEFVPALEAPAIREIGARYLAKLRMLAPSAAHVTDKMPSNYYFAGLIHLALPNARIIHARRDPVDTCMSCFSKLFTAEQNHTYDLGELGRYYARYEGLMAHSRRVLPAGRMLDVRYEDVVADLEGEARRILVHCGLAWDARCLAFHQTERPVRTASDSQVRQPIYRNAIGR